MKVNDIYEALTEPRFLVRVINIAGVSENSFRAEVISFPKNPIGWTMNKQKVGYESTYIKEDFKPCQWMTRDIKINQILE